MLSGAHNQHHKSLKDHLENTHMTPGQTGSAYPKNTADLLLLMNNFRSTQKQTKTGGTRYLSTT